MNCWKKYIASLDHYEQMRDDLACDAEAAQVPEELATNLEVGFEEAVVNVINYSGSEHIWIKTTVDAHFFNIEIIDHGVEFNPLVINDPRAFDDSPLEEREPGGFGIFLIKETFEKLEYAREDFEGASANHLSLSLRIDQNEI